MSNRLKLREVTPHLPAGAVLQIIADTLAAGHTDRAVRTVTTDSKEVGRVQDTTPTVWKWRRRAYISGRRTQKASAEPRQFGLPRSSQCLPSFSPNSASSFILPTRTALSASTRRGSF